MVQLLLDSLLAPIGSSATTIVRYSSHELDPFSMAGGLDIQSAGRCSVRRGRFQQADAKMQHAQQLLLKSDLVSAAEWVMSAHFISEGLLELSHKFQNMVLEHDLRQQGIPDISHLVSIHVMCVHFVEVENTHSLSCMYDHSLQLRFQQGFKCINVWPPRMQRDLSISSLHVRNCWSRCYFR